jgi:hypothetical protein
MSKIKSIFGSYAAASAMQLMINSAADKFAPTWFQNYFPWAPPQASLTYTTAIGETRIEAAASVVDRDSATPLRARPGMSKLDAEIPAIKVSRMMKESDYRDFLTLQNLPVADATKKGQLLDFMFADIKYVGNAVMKRLDILSLQALSTGKMSISATTNPDGINMPDIDLLMPDSNKTNSSVSWADAANAKPLTVDIPAVVEAAGDKGVMLSKILMSRALWLKFIQIAEVKAFVAAFIGQKVTGNLLVSLANVNNLLQENGWPVIEIVDQAIGIEKDGNITTIRPFDQNVASFIPAGPLGVIRNAIAIEELKPVDNVTYAKFNNALLSKWSSNEPFGEWTKGELNAVPSFEAIDSTFILKAVF